MVAFFGLAQACAVMVGERIGAQREKTAYIYARRFALLGPALGVLIGGVVLLAAGPALSMFRVPPAVTALAGQFAKVFALTAPIRIFNLIVIVGVLRSGGDTKFGLFVDTFGLWFIGVPLAMIVGLVLGSASGLGLPGGHGGGGIQVLFQPLAFVLPEMDQQPGLPHGG